jgi:hypothetical protein
MPRVSIPWRIFLGLEGIAFVASQTYFYFSSGVGPFLFMTQLFLLLPGSYLVGWRVEHLLWASRASLRFIGVVEILASIAVNALLWWVLTNVLSRLRRRVAL